MLKYRSTEKEQMDNLDLEGEELDHTLDSLSVINKYLGNTTLIFREVIKEIAKTSSVLTIIDLGCGGGDVLRAIASWASNNKQDVNLIGIDGNSNILNYALSKNTEAMDISYSQADILAPTFTLPACDILVSSHFMYHFTDEALVVFMRKVVQNVSARVIFSELARNSIAYILFKLVAFLLPLPNMVKQDGLKAIKRAFTRKELVSIISKSGISDFEIAYRWAFRYLVVVDVKRSK